jgi:carboxypeptidase C (cathepsin A)
MRFVAAAGLAATLATAAPASDLITSLPGWEGALPSAQYSGYLSISSTKHLHYWFVEAESNPASAPVVLWLNGGPGCSSLDGFFYEHGPFEINPSNYSQLTLREYRWSSIANTLYIEAPVGVGFSYADRTTEYRITDDSAADDNRAAVEKFFELFPEYQQNNFFLSGESYAGIYVPTLAEAILEATEAGTYTGAALKGLAVGNGCTGTELGICGSGDQGTYYEWAFLLGTAFVDQDLKDQINSACDWEAAAQNTAGALNAQCKDLLTQASRSIGNVNMYNVYGDCVSGDSCSSDSGPRHKAPLGSRFTPFGPQACIDSRSTSAYLNRDDVMEAIHVRDPGFCWTVCGTAPGWTYQSTRANLPRDTYPALIDNYRVLVFNGDWDACVPYTDNQAWTENMGYSVKDPWHLWTYTSSSGNAGQVAGYATTYSTGSSNPQSSFTFATVKGGRHEVPESAPAQAMELLSRFVNGEDF